MEECPWNRVRQLADRSCARIGLWGIEREESGQSGRACGDDRRVRVGAGDPTVSARSAAKGDVIQAGQVAWSL